MMLQKNHLNGTLPESWGPVGAMSDLDLRYNHLNVTVPKSWYPNGRVGPGWRANIADIRPQRSVRCVHVIIYVLKVFPYPMVRNIKCMHYYNSVHRYLP